MARATVSNRQSASNRQTVSNRQTLIIRRNGIGNSEDFTVGAWAKDHATITANQIANPVDGLTTASLMTEDATAASQHRVYHAGTTSRLVAYNSYTGSIYLKDSTRRYAGILFDTGPGDNTAIFDLQNGALSYTTQASNIKTITPHIHSLGNGWYRVGLTIVPYINIIGGLFFKLNLSDNGTSTIYNGDGTSSIYVFGAQFMQANWMGPYFQTTGLGTGIGGIRNLVALT